MTVLRGRRVRGMQACSFVGEDRGRLRDVWSMSRPHADEDGREWPAGTLYIFLSDEEPDGSGEKIGIVQRSATSAGLFVIAAVWVDLQAGGR